MLDAGERPELTVSDPSPNAAKLAAVDVPEPLEEPELKAAVRYLCMNGLAV